MSFIERLPHDPWNNRHQNFHMDWREYTYERLRWAHGPVRAAQIVNGEDAETKSDIALWRSLGERS